MSSHTRAVLSIAIASTLASAGSSFGIDVIKANNTSALNVTTSWVGGTAPTSADVAVWTSTVLTSNTVDLGAAISWAGIRIANPTGAVQIGTNTPTVANTLTLGTSGIDMSAATQNLTITPALIIGGAQTWNLLGGRTLTVQTLNHASSVTFSGSGNLNLTRTSTGTATIALLPGVTGSNLFTNDGASLFNYTGSWTIGSGVEVRTLRNGYNAWGQGSITLAGGMIAQHQNTNNTWITNIFLQSATTSTIGDRNTAASTLKLNGILSGTGNLIFDNTSGVMDTTNQGFILAANNTMSGTVTINANTQLRVGGIAGANSTFGSGNAGTLGTAGVIDNGFLQFARNDTQTYANSISGSGAVKVGFSAIVNGTNTLNQTVIMTGSNTYSGTTTINNGTLQLGNSGTTGYIGGGAITDNGTFTSNRSDSITLPNAISGTGAYTQLGTGTTTFTGTNSYTGLTTITNGTLQIGNGSTSGTLGTGNITNNGTLDFNRSNTYTYAGAISGSGAITHSGTGTTTLTGTSSFSGLTTINNGTLLNNGSFASSVVVNAAGTLGGTGTITGATSVATNGSITPGVSNAGTLTIGDLQFDQDGNVRYAYNGSGFAKLTINGALSFLPDTSANLIITGNVPVGTYNLIDSPSTDISGANFNLTLPPRIAGGLIYNGNNLIQLNVSELDTPKWTGAVSNIWDTTTSNLNWKEIINADPTYYIEGDKVSFLDDGDETSFNVTLNSTVLPTSVTINNASNTYTFTGSGKISGATGITKSGSGTVTIGNTGTNDYTGLTDIQAGTFKLGVSNVIPVASTTNLASGAVLDLASFNQTLPTLNGSGTVTNSGGSVSTLTINNSIASTLDATLVNGTSAIALVKTGTGTLTLTANSTTTGGLTVSTGAVQLGNAGATGSIAGPVVLNGTSALILNRSDTNTIPNAISGTGTLTKIGTNTTILTGTNTYASTSITGGTLQLGNGTANGSITGPVNVGTGAALNFNRNGSITVSNTFSGAGTVSFTGTGVQGDSSYAISTTNTLTGGYVINNGARAVVTSTSNFGTAPIIVNSGGGIYLNASSTFTNPFTISGTGWNESTGLLGAIRLGSSTVISSSITLAGDARITAYNLSAGTLSGVIGETGGARKLELGGTFTGTTTFSYGTITVSNSNTYSGGTDVRNVLVNINSNNAFGTGAVTLNGTDTTQGTRIQLASGVTVPNSLTMGAVAAIGGRGGLEGPTTGTATWSGSISITGAASSGGNFNGGGASGTGGLIITGPITSGLNVVQRAGTLILSGGGNYPALTSSGTLKIGANNGIATNASLTIGASLATTFDLSGFNQALTGLLHVTNTGTTTNSSGTLSTLTLNLSAINNYDGSLIGNLALVKTGAFDLILSGTNTYTGTTTISSGTLQVGNAGTTGTLGTAPVVDNGVLAFSHSDAITIPNAISGTGAVNQIGTGTTTFTGTNTYSGLTTISAGALQIGNGGTIGTLGTGAVTDNASLIFNHSDTLLISNAISGTGTVSQIGTGTTTFTGTNSYSGITTISAGALQIGSGSTTGTLGTGAVTDNASLIFNHSDALLVSNAISGTGAVNQIGTGTTTLTGTNGYSGLTTISSGALQIGNGNTTGTLGTGGVTDNATLILNHSDNITVANAISGTGAVSQIGTGTTTFTGTNTYSGITTISAGALQVGSGSTTGTLGTGAVTDNSALIFNHSDALLVSNAISGTGTVGQIGIGTTTFTGTNAYSGLTTISSGALQIGNGSTTGTLGTGAVTDNSSLIFNHSDALLVSNAISGTGTVSQIGTGTTTLTGTNGYSGLTTISAGALQIGNGGTIGTLGSNSVTNNATLIFNHSDSIAVANAISGTGVVNQIGTGTTTFTGNNSYSGITTISAGALQIGNGGITGTLGTGAVTDNAVLLFNRSDVVILSNPIAGTGAVAQIGAGTTKLTGTNSYSGITTISAGILQIGNASTTGTLGTGSVTDNASLVFNRSDNTTIANAISGTGTVNQVGAGTVTFTGSNSYSGVTTISSGAMQIGSGGTAGTLGTGSVTNNTNLIFNRSDAVTVANIISGTGSVSIAGSGTTTFTGNNSYGATSVNAGALRIGAGGTTGSLGTGDILDNALVVINRSNTYTIPGSITGTGSLTFAGSGTTTLTGTNSYSGITSITAGALQIGAGGTSGTLGTGGVTNNALVSFNRSDSIVIANAISGTGAVNQIGTGTISLTGTNTYSGATNVTGGTLAVNGTHTGGNNYTVAVSTTFAGTGTITPAATKTVTVNGTLAPGNSGIGTLTIAGGVILNNADLFQINSSNTTSDKLNATGNTITLGGSSVLSVSDIAGVPNFTAGQTFDLFDGSFSGFFSTIALPTLPGTLIWKTFSGSQLDYTTGQIQVIANGPPSSTWNVNSDGNWSTASNWTTNTIPTGIGAIATFDSVITAPHTVTVDSARTVGTLNFNNTNKYTIAGTSTLTLQGTTSAAINVTSGNHDITAPLALASNTTVTVGGSNTLKLTQLQPTTVDINKAGTGTMEVNNVTTTGALNISAGTVKVTPNGTSTGYSKINTLTTTGTGTLDITNNSAIITGTSESDVRTMITSGFNGGDWLGTGITSSNAANDNDGVTAVGYANNNDLGASDYNGVPLGATDTIVKYTYYGDADLSGTVTLEDFTQFLVGYQQGGTPNWINGDFDYSGTVTLEDFSLFLAGYQGPNTPLTPSLALALSADAPHSAPLAESISIVPEPTSLGLLAVGAMGLLRRRRK